MNIDTEDEPQVTMACKHEPMVVDGKVRCAKCSCWFALIPFQVVDSDDFWEGGP